MQTSDRTRGLRQSEIRAMTRACTEAGGINMAQGVCDLDIPAQVIEGAKQAMDEGQNIYMPCEGYPDLRTAVANRLDREHGMAVDAESQVFISAGATGAFYAVCMALFNPGDEVMLFEPYYGYHRSTLSAMGVNAVFSRLKAPSWAFDWDQMASLITDKTRALVLNTPANPSGKVISRDELSLLADFAGTHDLWIITDEMYEWFVYDGLRHIPPAGLPELADRTVTISGFSKIFSITGWRVGYAVCPPAVTTAAAHMNDLIYVCAPSPLQVGVCRGLMELPESYYQAICDDHRIKRDRFCTVLADLGLTPSVPSGAYYVLADISRVPGRDDLEKAMHILAKTGVACVPGRAFYHDDGGKNLARFCFAKKPRILDEACERMGRLFR
ncbi:pyridoxal phosphate-dependent aminotransferase [Desulfatiferula olefinivorans]